MTTPAEILEFWKGVGPKGWWRADPVLDGTMRSRFGAFHAEAAIVEPEGWRDSADGILALVILYDQFSRNLHRGTARAFAKDAAARALADLALSRGDDRNCDPALAHFFYLPFMHAEDLADQERCVELFRRAGGEDNLRYARIHRDVIAKFGRFPHRNQALGRKPTAEEEAFLANGGFSA
jgi:uncharacterized protein (DUF924 family)